MHMHVEAREPGQEITLAEFDHLLMVVDQNLGVGLHAEDPEITLALRGSALASAASALYLLATDPEMTPQMTASLLATAGDVTLAAVVVANGGDRHAMGERVALAMGHSLALFERAVAEESEPSDG